MTTADEVRAASRAAQPLLAERWLAVHLFNDALMVHWFNVTICHATLGFFKQHNRSPKRLARLKQSMCDLTIAASRNIKFMIS